MEFFKTLIHGNVLDTCPICLENIREKQTHVLKCKHQLHKVCYNSLLENNIHRCPSCREDFIKKEIKICQFCNISMEIDESNCNIVKSDKCNDCYFHYNCFKQHCLDNNNSIECRNCNITINLENISALSYFYFKNGYERWVGPIKKCKEINCNQICSPMRFGYCHIHKSDETTNKSIAKTFEYIIKYTNIIDQEEKYKIFYKVLYYMEKNFKYTIYEKMHINKSEIENEISKIFL
jgi:hypothetical protein